MFKISNLFLLLLFSCSIHQNSRDENKSMTKKETVEDLKVLIYALKKTYAGQYFAPGINIKELYRQLRKIPKKRNRQILLERLQAVFATLPDRSIKALSYLNDPKDKKIKPWKFEETSSIQKEGAYLKIPSFKSLNSPYWDRLKDELDKNMRKKSFLILDLRNSDGDDDSVGIYLARYFNGGVLRHPIIRQHHIRTKQSLRLLKNYWSLMSPNQKFPFPDYKKGESKILPIEFRRDQNSYSKKYSPNKNLYILVDESCKKPCETTLYALEKNPLTKIIGTKTKGQIHFGHPGLLLLPNSQISVLIPTSYNEFADGRFEEKRGFTPDFNCVTKQGSDDKLLQQLCETYW